MCLWWAVWWLTAPLSTLLIISNDFRYCTKQFALQDFPTAAASAQYAAQGMTVFCMTRCVCVCGGFICVVALEKEKWKMVRKREGGKEEREKELPDLKRQIRASLKSIKGEPCTDFISWQTCAAKGMQTDIDVWDWLISSFLKNVHTELRCRVCFWFVCLLSAHSILNTSLSVTFLLEKQTHFLFNR